MTAVFRWLVGVCVLAAAVSAGAQTIPDPLPLLSVTDGTLFPGLSEEIQIIEPGSRVMIEEALRGDRIIGLVTLRPDSVPNERGRGEIFPTGAICVIDDVARMPDGRLFVTVRSVMPFRIRREESDRVYRVAHVDVLPETVADGEQEALRQLRERIDELARAVDPVQLPEMSDTDRVNALAFYLDLDLFERQALLDHHGIVARAQAMVEILTMKLAAAPR